MNSSYHQKASLFRQLHQGPPILVLPNAWDAVSAKIFSKLGFPAIATTSAGIANCLGYPDGEHIPLDEMLFMVKRIIETIDVPVTTDFESGYTDDPQELAQTIAAVIGAGAVGINFEDSTATGELVDIALQAERIRAIRQAASSLDADLLINARTDAYLLGIGNPEERFPNTVSRARAYRDAGADSIFVPGVTDSKVIESLIQNIPAPINILAVANTPPVAVLEKLGVARVSVGSGPARACATLARTIGKELRETGTYTSFTEGAMNYQEVNSLFLES